LTFTLLWKSKEANSVCPIPENIHTLHRRDIWNFLGGGGSVRPICLRCVKLNTWNFQRGGEGGGRKKSLPWGGMDIYWKYTIKLVWNRLSHCSSQ